MTILFISSFSHSSGYFPRRLYNSNLLFLIPGGTFPDDSTIQFFYFSFREVLSRAALRFISSISHSRGYFPGGSTIQTFYFSFQGVFSQATLRFKPSISHSRGYFSKRLYDSILLFLIPGGTFPGGSTIHIFYFSFQGVFSQAALRFKPSISHSRGYFSRRLYDSYLLFLIPGGIFPGNSTIHIFYFSSQGVLSQVTLPFKITLPQFRG